MDVLYDFTMRARPKLSKVILDFESRSSSVIATPRSAAYCRRAEGFGMWRRMRNAAKDLIYAEGFNMGALV